MNARTPEPPPSGDGELVSMSLLVALECHPELHQLVLERDAFGRSKYGTGLRCCNGRDALNDARQEIGDCLQYLWQARMEGKEIGAELDMLRDVVRVLAEACELRATYHGAP